MSLYKEFEEVLAAHEKLYIFGAGEVGARIYELIVEHDGDEGRIQGVVASTREYLASAWIKQENMYPLDEIERLDIPFLVTVNRVYHPEVFELLENKGAKIIEGHKFFMLEKNNGSTVGDITPPRMLVLTQEEQSGLTSEELSCREKIIQMRIGNNQAFGEDGFYQSFPRLRLNGMRPTDRRIETYGLTQYLSQDAEVLDIGANTGFLDMEIAPQCKSVLGVEYNETLIDIANTAKEMLEIKNVTFAHADYSKWKKANNRRFDVIFSFAVHIWLGISPEMYAEDICDLLEENGIFLFESHNIKTDRMHKVYGEAFRDKGLEEIATGYIMDDGVQERKYRIFRKS